MDENAILDLLTRRLFGGGGSLVALYLFGSEAEGRARPDSDIDLAFLKYGSTVPGTILPCS